MAKPLLIVVLIVITILLFGAGLGTGVLYQTHKDASVLSSTNESVKKAELDESILSTLKSGDMTSISAYGAITKIEGKNITIQGNTGRSKIPTLITVKITDVANIYSITPAKDKTPQKTEALSFSSLKIGDSVTINLSILSDGSFQGSSVLVILR